MLHPGDSIHTGLPDRQRTYKNVLEAMRPGFQRNVKDFTQAVLNPDKLRTKQVSGETVTCESIVNYIKKWTECFQDCRVPSPMIAFDATAAVHNQRATECAVKAYASYMQEHFHSADHPYLAAELEQIHEAASRVAYEKFSLKSVGEDRHQAGPLRRLDEMIKSEHTAFKKINANLAVPVAKDVYDALWEDFIARQKQGDAHYHLLRAAFADKDREHQIMAYAKFDEFVVRGEESSSETLEKLEHELKISMLERKVNNGRNCYKHSMTIAQGSDEPWIMSRLQSSHERAENAAFDVADLNREMCDGDYALAREHLGRQIKVAKVSFIPPDMPGDKNVHAWDQAIAHYIKRMDRICKLRVSAYIEPRVFKTKTTCFVGEAKAIFKDRCAKDDRSAAFKETLMQEISRHQAEFEKINNKNWWWHTYKKVTTFVGAPFAAFVRRFARRGIGQQRGSGDGDVSPPLATSEGA